MCKFILYMLYILYLNIPEFTINAIRRLSGVIIEKPKKQNDSINRINPIDRLF